MGRTIILKYWKIRIVAYIKLKSMMTHGHSFSSDEDGKVIYEFLQRVQDYPYLIVDIRGNGGGSDGYWRNNLVPICLINTRIMMPICYIKIVII